ncbi:MAG: ankyrin repeat domain-containing protein [Fimbriimonadaceae bacterium]
MREKDAKGVRKFLRSQDDIVAAVNEVDEGGGTPLYYAVSSEEVSSKIVVDLLASGADIDFERVETIPGIGDVFKGIGNAVLASLGLKDATDLKLGESITNREPVIRQAIKYAKVEVLKLFVEAGADLSYCDAHGYTAMIDAAYRQKERLPVIEFLISQGADVNARTTYNETAIRTAYQFGDYETVKALLAAGADDSQLGWDDVIRAVAIGSRQDVETALARSSEVRALDSNGMSAIQVALRKGDLELAELLLQHGANPARQSSKGASSIACSIESGSPVVLEWALRHGCDINEHDKFGNPVLGSAVSSGNIEIVRFMLEHGADPNAGDTLDSVLQNAPTREIVELLISSGADPANLDNEGRRKLVGLGEQNVDILLDVTLAQFKASRHLREGKSNPDDLTDAFKVAMIKAGVNAYRPRTIFNEDPNYACSTTGIREDAVWCADRFGQTVTQLLDGRAVMIGGEHEDSYDPDFCIYNDVIVFDPSGTIKVYGYPFSDFEPTDFHTATLVGDFIYVIGGLGYVHQRKGVIPVYRLNTHTYQMERVQTRGDVPPRVFKHRADRNEGSIVVKGGKAIGFRFGKESHDSNTSHYSLDTKTHVWTCLHG